MTRVVRSLALVVALSLFTLPAHAQDPAPEGESTGSGPLPGYIATGMLAAAAMFVLCKSARRS